MQNMKTGVFDRLRSSEGKGVIGCMLAIVMLAAAIYLGIILVPIYFANYNFESDIKTAASRAGARFSDNDQIIKDVLALAKKNEIRITREDVTIDRFAGQLHIRLTYSVPVDFIILEQDLTFKIDASSFIGTL
jgi:hypothetical protein